MNKNKTTLKTQFHMDVTQEAVASGTIHPTFLMHNQVILQSFTHSFLSVVSFISVDLEKIKICSRIAHETAQRLGCKSGPSPIAT